jgi:type II secretory pathway pseudopilin PulG
MIEAVVIVAILAILAGVLTPMVIKEVGKSKTSRVKNDMDAIATAFLQYYTDTSYWPEKWSGESSTKKDFVGYDCLYTNSKKLGGWDGPYLERGVLSGSKQVVAKKSGGTYIGIVDPWDRPFKIYYGKKGSSAAGPGGAIAVVCSGPNGKFETNYQNAFAGVAQGDDLVRVITKRVN